MCDVQRAALRAYQRLARHDFCWRRKWTVRFQVFTVLYHTTVSGVVWYSMVQYSTRRAEQVLRVVLVALPATRATNKTKHLLRDAAAKGRTAQTAGSLQTLHDSGQDKRHALRVRRARENLARGREKRSGASGPVTRQRTLSRCPSSHCPQRCL